MRFWYGFIFITVFALLMLMILLINDFRHRGKVSKADAMNYLGVLGGLAVGSLGLHDLFVYLDSGVISYSLKGAEIDIYSPRDAYFLITPFLVTSIFLVGYNLFFLLRRKLKYPPSSDRSEP